MIRPFSAAAIAVVFAGALSSAADARPHAIVHPAAATETLSQVAAREHVSLGDLANVSSLGASATLPEQPYTIPEATRRSLEKAEVESMMPHGGDLAMWTDATPQKATNRTKNVATQKKTDQLRRFASGIISRTSSIAMSLTRSAMRFIGTPYVFGGTSPSGFDCSGYTQHVFAMLGISLPRTADAQFYAGRPAVGGLTTGDLVFFQTYEPGPSHVGIYIGNGRFIHSSSHGVMISPLAQSYWASRYLGAKRVANLK